MNAPVRLSAADAPAAESARIALGSGDPTDLALIRRPSIALVEWWRPAPVTIAPDAIALPATIRLEGDPDDAADAVAEALAEGPPQPWHAPLAVDAGLLARRFAAIAGCAEVALRFECIDSDACHRFHADYVPLRLIVTYAGRGTEWVLGDGGDPVVHRLRTGHVGLFKGRGSGPIGLLHRSPPIAGSGERRLVLVIDPLTPDDDRMRAAP